VFLPRNIGGCSAVSGAYRRAATAPQLCARTGLTSGRAHNLSAALAEVSAQSLFGNSAPTPIKDATGPIALLLLGPVYAWCCYCTALIMSKMGRYIATTMPPTITPKKTIINGSMAASNPLTAASTSSS
jgi:hypothetical protein